MMALNPAAMADAPAGGQPGTVPGPRDDHEVPHPLRQDGAGGAGQAGDDTLAWSLTAMSGALRRLAAARASNTPQAVAAATEAVWWVTVVDAAMTRRHPAAYGRALAALDPAERRAIEGSLAGLRFVRIQLGQYADPGDFIQPPPGPSAGRGRGWTWSELPPPPQRGRTREVSPYRQYRAQLAGRPVARVLERVAGFLSQAHATAGASRAGRLP
jgi:hypothetical protein